MFGSFYRRGKHAWVQDVRGAFVCIDEGELVATVPSTEWEPWQIVMLFPGEGASRFASMVLGESFENRQAAMSRAEEILDGTTENLMCLPMKRQAFRSAFVSG